jgi:4-hydroxy-tetrahydrodipicolinate synthase
LEEGQLDEEGLRKNIRVQIAAGIDGITILGSTGESPTLSEDEQERIIKIAAEETHKKIGLMVGTGCFSTAHAIEKSRRALRGGADSLLVVTPYYNKPTQEGLYRHFKAIAEAVDLPMILYNTQGRTGQNIHTETIQRLAHISNIVGVKESSGNMEQIINVIEKVGQQRADFVVVSGDDILTMPLMAMGGHGVISVASNLIPKAIKKLTTLLQEGDYAAARQLQYAMMPFFRSNFVETNPIPIKAAMQWSGRAAGGCRLPLCELSSTNASIVREALDSIKDWLS